MDYQGEHTAVRRVLKRRKGKAKEETTKTLLRIWLASNAGSKTWRRRTNYQEVQEVFRRKIKGISSHCEHAEGKQPSKHLNFSSVRLMPCLTVKCKVIILHQFELSYEYLQQ
jgi:hypothetical protein